MIRLFRKIPLAVLLLLAAGVPARAEQLRNHFDSDAMMGEPAFFDFVVLGAPGEARWKVVSGYNPPSAPNHVAQTVSSRPADSIAAAVRRNSAFRDGVWSVGLMRGSGRGGIVFRMSGEKDFLALLVDLVNGQARLLRYRNGRQTQLASGVAKLANEWSILKITSSGEKVTALWDGSPLLEASDASPSSGRSGMATAGPGLVAFDEFVLDPAP